MIAVEGLITYSGIVPGLRAATVRTIKGNIPGLFMIEDEVLYAVTLYLFEHPEFHAQAT